MRRIFCALAVCGVLFMSCGVSFCETMGERNALRSAKMYLELMGFSYSGLMKHLETFDEYSHEEAEYAVNNCGADWNEQAARKAKEYLELMGFSRSKLINQLEAFDGFTREQAEYGVTQAGY